MVVLTSPQPDRLAVPHLWLRASAIFVVLGTVVGLSGDIITIRLSDQLYFSANTVFQGGAGRRSPDIGGMRL